MSDRLSGLFFLCVFLLYGWFIEDIYLDFWAEEEFFTARTFPTLIAIGGVVVSLLLIITPAIKVQFRAIEPMRAFQCALLLGLMVIYGLTLEILGFLLCTALFLLGCSLVLGERRPLYLLFGTLPLPVFFYVLMDFLDIYLAPGSLVQQVFSL